MKWQTFLKGMDEEVNETGIKEIGPAVKSGVKSAVKSVGQKLKTVVSKLEDGWQKFRSFIGKLKNGKFALFSKSGEKISKEYEKIERIDGNIPLATDEGSKKMAALNVDGKEQSWVDGSGKIPVMFINDKPGAGAPEPAGTKEEDIDLSPLVPLFETMSVVPEAMDDEYTAGALYAQPGQLPTREKDYAKQKAMLPTSKAAEKHDISDLPWMVGPEVLREVIIPRFIDYALSLIGDVQSGEKASERPSMALFGPQGTAKSAIVEKEFGDRGYKVMVLPTSSIPKEAISGIPQSIITKEGRSVIQMGAITGGPKGEGRLMPPNKKAKESGYQDKFVLFLDEYNRASPAIFNALMTMFSSGKIGDHYELPDRTIIIIAGNQRDDPKGQTSIAMMVKALDPALQKRLKFNFYINYDFREWLAVHSTHLKVFHYNAQDAVEKGSDVLPEYKDWLNNRMAESKNKYVSLNVPPILPIIRTAIQRSIYKENERGTALTDPKIWAAPAKEFAVKFGDMENVEDAPERLADYSTFSALDKLMKTAVVSDYIRSISRNSAQGKHWEKKGKKVFPEIKDPIEAALAAVMFDDAQQEKHADVAPLILRGKAGSTMANKLKTYYNEVMSMMRPAAAIYNGLGNFKEIQAMEAIDVNMLGFGIPGILAAAESEESLRALVMSELKNNPIDKKLHDWILERIKEREGLFNYVATNIILFAGTPNAIPESLTTIFISSAANLENMVAKKTEAYIKSGMSKSEAETKAAEEKKDYYRPIQHLVGLLQKLAEGPPDVVHQDTKTVKKGQAAVLASTSSGLNTSSKLANDLKKMPDASVGEFLKAHGTPVVIKQIMRTAGKGAKTNELAKLHLTAMVVGIQTGYQRALQSQVREPMVDDDQEVVISSEKEAKSESLYVGRNSVLMEVNIPKSTLNEMLKLAGVK